MRQWLPEPKIREQKFPNQPVLLYDGSAELVHEGGIIQGKNYVQIDWYPFPSITGKFTYYSQDITKSEEIELKLTELIPQSRIKVYSSGSTYYYGTGKCEVFYELLEPFRQGTTDNLSSVTFHVTNFFWFNISNEDDYNYDEAGNEIVIEREGWLMFQGQFIFDYDNWHIVLATLDNGSELQDKLDTQGGYGITHICKIEHSDEQTFNLDEAYQIIDAFIYYLSFVRGFWVAPLLVSGFNAKGDQILEEWCTPKIKADLWQSEGYSWTNPDTTEITDYFSGFMKKWEDENWKETIQNAIQWYIESHEHTNRHNTSIILVQAALEKLAWTYLNTNNCISANSFKKSYFTLQLTLLLKYLNIPILYVSNDFEIIKLAKEREWISNESDSIKIIEIIRNLIVHPKINKKENNIEISKTILSEVFDIAHYYLLQCLLKIFQEPVNQ